MAESTSTDAVNANIQTQVAVGSSHRDQTRLEEFPKELKSELKNVPSSVR